MNYAQVLPLIVAIVELAAIVSLVIVAGSVLEVIRKQGENLRIMLTPEQLQALKDAIASAKDEIRDALSKEKDELVAMVQKLKDKLPSSGISAAELDELVTGIKSIGSSAAASIDNLSVEADPETPADPGTPATGEPTP